MLRLVQTQATDHALNNLHFKSLPLGLQVLNLKNGHAEKPTTNLKWYSHAEHEWYSHAEHHWYSHAEHEWYSHAEHGWYSLTRQSTAAQHRQFPRINLGSHKVLDNKLWKRQQLPSPHPLSGKLGYSLIRSRWKESGCEFSRRARQSLP